MDEILLLYIDKRNYRTLIWEILWILEFEGVRKNSTKRIAKEVKNYLEVYLKRNYQADGFIVKRNNRFLVCRKGTSKYDYLINLLIKDAIKQYKQKKGGKNGR